MQLLNFSRYEITINGDTMRVQNLKTGNILSPKEDRYHKARKYELTDDNGNKKTISEQRIAFSLIHSVPLHKLPSSAKFFGTVSNPVLGKRVPNDNKNEDVISRIMELEQALDMMKYAYYCKDYSRFVEFAYTRKGEIIGATSKRLCVSFSTLEKYYDEGIDLFLDSVKNMTFTSLKPIINYLCTSLKYAYLRNKSKDLPIVGEGYLR